MPDSDGLYFVLMSGCSGVPFINPILQWDPENPQDKSRWDSQHVILRYLDPPYVYNVQKDDEQGLIDAINAAYENPIDRFVTPCSRSCMHIVDANCSVLF